MNENEIYTEQPQNTGATVQDYAAEDIRTDVNENAEKEQENQQLPGYGQEYSYGNGFAPQEYYGGYDGGAEIYGDILHMQSQNFRQIAMDNIMRADLREIQSVYPTVTSLRDLPSGYCALRFNPGAPMTALQAYKAVKAAYLPDKPPSTGSVTGGGNFEKEFFTGEELDRLKKSDLSDPGIMEKAMRSMSRLK